MKFAQGHISGTTGRSVYARLIAHCSIHGEQLTEHNMDGNTETNGKWQSRTHATCAENISSGDGGDIGCFIATAAYGSMVEPHVKILRDFRDRFLMTDETGKLFVVLYYKYSPPLAGFIAKHDNLRMMIRIALLPVIGMSWVSLKSGVSPVILLMVVFGIGAVGSAIVGRKF